MTKDEMLREIGYKISSIKHKLEILEKQPWAKDRIKEQKMYLNRWQTIKALIESHIWDKEIKQWVCPICYHPIEPSEKPSADADKNVDELVETVDEIKNILNIIPVTQATIQKNLDHIKQLLLDKNQQQKPKVSREWVKNWVGGVTRCCSCLPDAIELLKELGYEIENK